MKMPIYAQLIRWAISIRKVGQTDIVFGARSGFIVGLRTQNYLTSLCVQRLRFVPPLLTSNVTGRHRGPKQKLRAGYRALSPKQTFYPASASVTAVLVFVVECYGRHIFHRRVWYRALSLRYACIRASSSSPRLPLCQISFLWQLPVPH